MPKPIRDPIYNYIPITKIELSVMDREEFQRLRFILQNSSAYLTYPSNNNSRFVHSLGVMHLSGLLFVKSLENAPQKTLVNFLSDAEIIIKRHESEIQGNPRQLQKEWHDVLGNASGFSHNSVTEERIKFEEEKRTTAPDSNKHHLNYLVRKLQTRFEHNPYYIINTLWQAVRLCGLAHDIGHMPMSHLFEDAIEEFGNSHIGKSNLFSESEIKRRRKKYSEELAVDEARELTAYNAPKLHELLGLILFWSFVPEKEMYFRLVYSLAKTILLLNPEVPDLQGRDPDQLLRCLHGIISGELDADRLDYCLRDPRVSGLELGAIDLQRILDNMALHQNSEGHFQILPTDKTLSAIESFFHQRYLVYKYLVYHHNVVRMDGILKEILVRLLEQAYRKDDDNKELRDLLDKFGFKTEEAGDDECHFLSIDRIRIFDDAWLRTLLSQTITLLDKEKENSSDAVKKWANPLCLLISTFLYRKSENLYSMWKRDTDFHDTYREVSLRIAHKLENIEKLRPLIIRKLRDQDKEPWKSKPYFEQVVVNPLKSELEPYGVVVIFRHMQAKIFDTEKRLQVLVGNPPQVKFVDETSPYVGSLRSVAENAPNVHISFVGDELKSKEISIGGKTVKLQEHCRNLLLDKLAEYVKSYLHPELSL